MTRRALRATAYHEAGHAVVALLWEHPTMATIVPSGDALGSTRHRSWGARFRPDLAMTPGRAARLQARITTLLAGDIAERRATGSRSDGGAFDRQAAVDLAAYLNGSDRQIELYLAWRAECARQAVETYWPQIDRLAEALLDHKTLRGDDLRQAAFGEMR
jgi:ATP-dependent Zn protease